MSIYGSCIPAEYMSRLIHMYITSSIDFFKATNLMHTSFIL